MDAQTTKEIACDLEMIGGIMCGKDPEDYLKAKTMHPMWLLEDNDYDHAFTQKAMPLFRLEKTKQKGRYFLYPT
jgi:hypothetical protein